MLLLATALLFGQESADPLHEIYDHFDRWEGAGYLTGMPAFRPYPEPVIRDALRRVVLEGDPEARRTAGRYLERFVAPVDVEWEIIQENRLMGEKFHTKGGIGVAIHGRLGDRVDAAGSITGVLLDMEEGELLPAGRRTDWDILDDWSSIPLGGRDVAALNQVNTSFAWGRESLYLHAGIMRRSFGPIHGDGVVWSAYAKQSPNLVGYWQSGDFSFSFGLFSLTATQRFRELTPFNRDDLSGDGVDVVNGSFRDGEVTDDSGPDMILDPDQHPGKWTFLQQFRWSHLSWLTLSFFESATWGPRFELAYLLPLKWG